MKSEQRHQLQTNILADQTGKAIEQSKPYVGGVLIGIGVLALLGIGLAFWHNSAQSSNSLAWTDYYFASGRPDDLVPIYEDFPSSTAADWARQAEADSRFAQGLELVFRDRKQADDLILKAKKAYEGIADSTSQPVLRARATFGLAQALESMGDAENATATYKKLKQMESVTPSLATEIDRRLDWLQGSDAKAFFAWYKEYTPTPAAPLSLPNSLNDLPGAPNTQFGNFPNLPNASPVVPPSGESTAPAAPAGSEPAANTNPPATPAPTAPAESSPATPATTPASETPAAATPAAAPGPAASPSVQDK